MVAQAREGHECMGQVDRAGDGEESGPRTATACGESPRPSVCGGVRSQSVATVSGPGSAAIKLERGALAVAAVGVGLCPEGLVAMLSDSTGNRLVGPDFGFVASEDGDGAGSQGRRRADLCKPSGSPPAGRRISFKSITSAHIAPARSSQKICRNSVDRPGTATLLWRGSGRPRPLSRRG